MIRAMLPHPLIIAPSVLAADWGRLHDHIRQVQEARKAAGLDLADKIVLDLGGLQPSYDGPAETRYAASPRHVRRPGRR